jgi:hypothetical protein
MRPLTLAHTFVGLLAGFALLLLPQAGHSQGAGGKRVKFETFDEVELVGDFYASAKGKEAAPVMIIPSTAGHRKQPELEALAKALQAAGHAVLIFDLRGQGDSTSVGKTFWNQQINKKSVAPSPDGNGIRPIRDAGYLPMMVNDIMAAKLFLDRRNDSGDCNSKKLILLGVGDGASLGALWLATESKRYRVTQSNKLNGLPIAWQNNPECRETLAMISLNIGPNIGRGGANPIQWLYSAKENKVRMAFLYGGAVPGYSERCRLAIGKADKFTVAKGIKNGDQRSGSALLKPPETTKLITNYIDNILEDQGNNDWAMAETEKNSYVWVFKGNSPTMAKMEGEKNMNLVPLASFGYTNVP